MRSGTVEDCIDYPPPESSLTQVLDLLDEDLTREHVVGRLTVAHDAARRLLLGSFPILASAMWVTLCSLACVVMSQRSGIPATPELLIPLCSLVFTVAWFTQGLVGHYNVLLPIAGALAFGALMVGSLGSFVGILGPATAIAAVRRNRASD